MTDTLSIVALVLSIVALIASVVQFLITRSDSFSSAKEQRLRDLEVKYAEKAQPAMAQLDAIKTLHAGDALWNVLQFVPPIGAAGGEDGPDDASALKNQQLRAAHMELMVKEQAARNAIKGFWNDTLRAMEEDKLPKKFKATPDRISFGSSTWVNRANNFRELTEPFDIANYYRLELDRESGHYLHGGRGATYVKLENMWRQHCRARKPPSATYKSSVAWAEAMERVRGAPEVGAADGSAVARLPPPVLPPGTLLLVRRAL